MELGENLRFKFVIEPVFLALSAIVCYRLLQGARDATGTVESAADSDPQAKV